MKPIDELVSLTQDEILVAPMLGVYPEYVRQWRPRVRWHDGVVEPGLEPSQGFIALALARLRSHV